MSATTIFLGRLLGLYLVAISAGMLAPRRTLATLDEMARSGPWMLFSGMVATAAGLAVVLGHNVWSGGALPVVVVTLMGWASLLLEPWERMADAYKFIGFGAVLPCLDGRRAGDRAVGDGDGLQNYRNIQDCLKGGPMFSSPSNTRTQKSSAFTPRVKRTHACRRVG